jgi:hypothetical protein
LFGLIWCWWTHTAMHTLLLFCYFLSCPEIHWFVTVMCGLWLLDLLHNCSVICCCSLDVGLIGCLKQNMNAMLLCV